MEVPPRSDSNLLILDPTAEGVTFANEEEREAYEMERDMRKSDVYIHRTALEPSTCTHATSYLLSHFARSLLTVDRWPSRPSCITR